MPEDGGLRGAGAERTSVSRAGRVHIWAVPGRYTGGMGPRLQHTDWLTGRVPDEVRERIRSLVEVLGYLPHLQPLGVVTTDAVLLAANRPLLDLVEADGDELLGADWADVMPGWDERVRGWDAADDDEPRTHTFEEHVVCAGGRELWAHVVATPVVTAGGSDLFGVEERALAAWTLFVSDSSPAHPDEAERRRREILDLLLESPGAYVVKLGGDGRLEFVSPSLCAAARMSGRRAARAVAGRRRAAGAPWPAGRGVGRGLPGAVRRRA